MMDHNGRKAHEERAGVEIKRSGVRDVIESAFDLNQPPNPNLYPLRPIMAAESQFSPFGRRSSWAPRYAPDDPCVDALRFAVRHHAWMVAKAPADIAAVLEEATQGSSPSPSIAFASWRSRRGRFAATVVPYVMDADPGKAAELMAKVQARKPRLIFAVGTNAAQIASQRIHDVPIVYSMVLNPTPRQELASANTCGISLRCEPEGAARAVRENQAGHQAGGGHLQPRRQRQHRGRGGGLRAQRRVRARPEEGRHDEGRAGRPQGSSRTSRSTRS